MERKYSEQANQLIWASKLYLAELLDAPEYWRIVQAINKDMVMVVVKEKEVKV